MRIIDIKSTEILDSRGYPTIETKVVLENGVCGVCSIPSGASTGCHEALELRDNDKKRYDGKGVLKAIDNVLNIIKPALICKDIKSQRDLDELLIKLDGTDNKSKLGANAVLSVSLAYFKACCNFFDNELYEELGNSYSMPKCMFNILNGGCHAPNNIDFQEFMIMVNRDTIKEQLEVSANIFHTLKRILIEKGKTASVGDEGGFAPTLNSNEEAIELIMEAIKKSNYKPYEDVNICLDIAASTLYDKTCNKYLVDNKKMSSLELLNFYKYLIDKYPIYSIEDPFYEEDFLMHSKLTSETNILVVGDDLFTTNIERLKKGVLFSSCNAILLKANQIGTITEMLDVIKYAKAHNYKTIISHRSGETEDTFIADFAVGLNLGYMKSGSLSRGERICKYNRLIRIEEMLK